MDLAATSGNGDGAQLGTPAAQVKPGSRTQTTQDNPAHGELYDITIIGAGPTGLYGAFYAGMRELKTLIVDALPEAGGQLTALYPEKYIYDAPGYPKVIAKDLVKSLLEQAVQWNPTLRLGE